MEKVTIKKSGNIIDVNMQITVGKFFALLYGLQEYETTLARELVAMIREGGGNEVVKEWKKENL